MPLTINKPFYQQDMLVKELPQDVLALLYTSNLPWLNSPQFCLGYASEPAERVWMRRDEEKIHDVTFYRIVKKNIITH
jgi:hypothetical protein